MVLHQDLAQSPVSSLPFQNRFETNSIQCYFATSSPSSSRSRQISSLLSLVLRSFSPSFSTSFVALELRECLYSSLSCRLFIFIFFRSATVGLSRMTSSVLIPFADWALPTISSICPPRSSSPPTDIELVANGLRGRLSSREDEEFWWDDKGGETERNPESEGTGETRASLYAKDCAFWKIPLPWRLGTGTSSSFLELASSFWSRRRSSVSSNSLSENKQRIWKRCSVPSGAMP